MHRRQRRLLGYVAAVVAAVVLYTVVYSWAMGAFENEPRTLVESLLVVVETFTTTGYGEDAIWTSPQLVGLMVAMQFTGVFFIFMALPLFVAPWIEATLSTTPPDSVDDAADHVIVCGWSGRTDTLIEELELYGVPFLIVEPDRDRAIELYEDDVPVIHGDPETGELLQRARVGVARSVVCDLGDERNAAVALEVQGILAGGGAADGVGTGDADGGDSGRDVQVMTFAEDPAIERYHRYAGADHVFAPRRLIGESLANKVATSVSTEVGDAIEIGEDLEIVELPVQAGAELVATRIAKSGIRERTGANVVGAWFRGEFVSPPSPQAVIDERTVLLVAGREDQLERLKELTLSESRRLRRGPVIVGGYGEVGSAVEKRISGAGLPCRVVDLHDGPGVDVVGDVTEPDVLATAGIDDASTVILALPTDTLAIFATLVVRELAPEVEIVARANDTDNVRKLYRAGADYVLALSTVSGRMLASTIFEEEVISYDQQIEIVRLDAGSLADRSLADADLQARTGCTVVAVERNGAVLTDLDASFRFESGDEVIVAGPDAAVAAFSGLVTD